MFIKIVRDDTDVPSLNHQTVVYESPIVKCNQREFGTSGEYEKWCDEFVPFEAPYGLRKAVDDSSNKAFTALHITLINENEDVRVVIVDQCVVYIMNDAGKTIDTITVW